jgi:hypothetical protein
VKLNFLFRIVIIAILMIFPSTAQDASLVITASNIRQLQPVAQIDFADLPEESGAVQNGWFVVNPQGNQFIVKSRSEHLLGLDQNGTVLADYVITTPDGLSATVMDAAFDQTGKTALSVHSGGGAFYLATQYSGVASPYIYKFQSADIPVRLWQNDDKIDFLEIMSADPAIKPYILKLPVDPLLEMNIQLIEVTLDDLETTEVAPDSDPDAYLRIGRIEPPLAISVTESGLLKLWDLETGQLTSTVELGQIPGMGAINAAGTSFAWRDSASTNLHLLDFESGIDSVITSLGGTYLPFLLLSANADVMIGVNIGGEPNVVAWDVTTGDRLDLGDYRACNRQPDLVRLSRDGSTLVIGCDAGLEIWRISLNNQL